MCVLCEQKALIKTRFFAFVSAYESYFKAKYWFDVLTVGVLLNNKTKVSKLPEFSSTTGFATTKSVTSFGRTRRRWSCPQAGLRPPQRHGNCPKTSIDYLPATDSLNTSGLNVRPTDLSELLSVDNPGWLDAVPQIRDHFATFGDRPPSELTTALDTLESRPA
jgi:hypothetical protein